MKRTCVCVAAALLVLCSGQVRAQGVDQPTADLPPDGVYLSPDDVHAMYTGPSLTIVLSAIQHRPFQQPPPIIDYGPEGERHTFGSSLDGLVSVNGGPLQPFYAEGQVHTVALGRGPTDATGTFQTEMLGMDLVGSSGIMIRESPTLESLGQTTITDLGSGGPYHIDSFFDVFTELSLDGGSTWIPNSGGPTHVVLGIPEPTSFALMGLALIGLAGWKRRRG